MLRNRQTILSILISALAFGTAWAVRGKFGHEQGAAWAGAIGTIAVVLSSKRTDWYDKVWKLALAGAVGWGIGGMISYGVVVGYGRGSEFFNVYYGLAMLFVIGALYGFLGGGFVGLALLQSRSNPIKWSSLIVEMVAIGLLTYSLVIDQLEWLMTPPRSEAWAVCFGSAIALAWYILRNGYASALKVAICSALGGGFGFAFGNFLQVMGSGSSLPFNFWNIMEYSIGFFGGGGMAYGILTSSWPGSTEKPERISNLVPILLLVVFIPFVIWDQSFEVGKLDFILKQGGDEQTVSFFQWMAGIAIALGVLIIFINYYRAQFSFNDVRSIFLISTVLYTFLSFLQTGIYIHPVEQYLYIANIILIVVLLPRVNTPFELRSGNPKHWFITFVAIGCILALLAAVAINSHGELKGAQIRFK